jgi:hypothetical protein
LQTSSPQHEALINPAILLAPANRERRTQKILVIRRKRINEVHMDNAVEARQQEMNPEPLHAKARSTEQPVTEEGIQNAIAQAQNACRTTGEYSSECTDAWDKVQEMRATRTQQQGDQQSQSQTSLEKYCEMRPDADECRVYDL